jgi:hypothetical protein
MAALRCRFPLRERRCRAQIDDHTGNGTVPLCRANASFEWKRSTSAFSPMILAADRDRAWAASHGACPIRGVSQHFAYAHASAGIRLVFGEAIEGDNSRVCAASGRSGERYPSDIVVIGIGVDPNTELATAADFQTSTGLRSIPTYAPATRTVGP